MIMHVLKDCGFDFDYMVGARVSGFETMVRLSDAPLIILEGDEYLASPVDHRPKFHLYRATIGLISGIAWDHINVFPTFENYLEQFKIFADNIPPDGALIYFEGDEQLTGLCTKSPTKADKIPYGIPAYHIKDGTTYLETLHGDLPVSVFGEHNIANMEGAHAVCRRLGVPDEKFYKSIRAFSGAARRLELLGRNDVTAIYRDFAHSPSKLHATIHAVHHQFPKWKLIACMELHTFSSLNQDFLEQYKNTMDDADVPIVYFNPHTIEHKKLRPISEEQVRAAFANPRITVFTESKKLRDFLLSSDKHNSAFLMMSSGTFDQMDLQDLAGKIIRPAGQGV
jgi:UDP-N-acetylmuramate: L-alanyl-gamma-D-glutamyl-meso-diaminopimelate ligase